jgi:hypothetical protein
MDLLLDFAIGITNFIPNEEKMRSIYIILFTLFYIPSGWGNTRSLLPSRTCNQIQNVYEDAMTHKTYNPMTDSPTSCDVDINGNPFSLPDGIGGYSYIGWKTIPSSTWPFFHQHYRTYFHFELPSDLEFANIVDFTLKIPVTDTNLAMGSDIPKLRLYISPSMVSTTELLSWNGDGTVYESVPPLPVSGEFIELSTSISNNEIIADIPISLWYLLLDYEGFVISTTIIPEDEMAGAQGTQYAGFTFSVGTVFLEIEESTDPEEVQWPGNLCAGMCLSDTENPEIHFTQFSSLWPFSCGNDLTPTIGLRQLPLPSDIDTITQEIPGIEYSGNLPPKPSCIYPYPPNVNISEELYASAAYSPTGFIIAPYYAFGIAITDNHSLRMVEIKTTKSNLNTETNYTWIYPGVGEVPRQWPFPSYKRNCQDTTNSLSIFGGLPDIPDPTDNITLPSIHKCSTDWYEMLIPPVESFCDSESVEVEVIATDLRGNSSTRKFEIIGKGDKTYPQIMTPDNEILRINKTGTDNNGTPILLPGDYVDFMFDIHSPGGISEIVVGLHDATLIHENWTGQACDTTDASFLNNPPLINVIKTGRKNYRVWYRDRPEFLRDRKFLYDRPQTTTFKITLKDGDGDESVIKELPVMLHNYSQFGRFFNLNNSITNAEKNSSTGQWINHTRDSRGRNLLPTEGFFMNFHNDIAAGIDALDGWKDWSFARAYMTTYHSKNGEPGWEGWSNTEIAFEVAICVAGIGLTAVSGWLGGAVLAETCSLVQYIVGAPILAMWLNEEDYEIGLDRSGYCGGYSTTFQMWRTGKIDHTDFNSCGYYEGDPAATNRKPCSTEGSNPSDYCYFDCCSIDNRRNNNSCHDRLESNDMMQYVAGMHGKQVTAEYLKFATSRNEGGYKGVTDNFLKNLFYSMKPRPGSLLDLDEEEGIFEHTEHIDSLLDLDEEDGFFELAEHFNNIFSHSWEEIASFTDPRYLIEKPVVLNINWPEAGHLVTPLHAQILGDDLIRVYLYDSNYPDMTYGMRCLREQDPNSLVDTSPDSDSSGDSWGSLCGPRDSYGTGFFSGYKYPIRDEKKSNSTTHPYIDLNLNTREYFNPNYPDKTTENIALITMHNKHTSPINFLESGICFIEGLTDDSSTNVKSLKNKKPFLKKGSMKFFDFPIEQEKKEEILTWIEDGLAFCHHNWGKKYIFSVMSLGYKDDELKVSSNHKNRTSLFTLNSSKFADVRVAAYFPTTRKTLNGKKIRVNGEPVIKNHSYLGFIKFDTDTSSLGSLVTGWEENKSLFLENLNEHEIEYEVELHTSYIPYFEELNDATDIQSLAKIVEEKGIPFKKSLNGVIPPGKRITITPAKWYNLPDSEVIIKESKAIGDPDYSPGNSDGCSCKTAPAKSSVPLTLIIIVSLLMLLIRFFVFNLSLFAKRNVSMKIFVLFFSIFFLISCDNFFDDPGHSEFKMDEHYLVVDYTVDGTCLQEGIEFIYEGKVLEFKNGTDGSTRGTVGEVRNPNFKWANTHDEYSAYIDRGLIKTNNCRLLVDVDAVKAIPLDPKNNYEQITDQPTEPFHLELAITTGDATATIDATHLPYTWDQYEECNNDGLYEESEYPQLYNCIESLDPHEVVDVN